MTYASNSIENAFGNVNIPLRVEGKVIARISIVISPMDDKQGDDWANDLSRWHLTFIGIQGTLIGVCMSFVSLKFLLRKNCTKGVTIERISS